MKKLFYRKNSLLPDHIKNLQSIYQFIEIGHVNLIEKGQMFFDKFLYYCPLDDNYSHYKIDLNTYWNRIKKQKIVKSDLLVKALKDCPKGEVIIDACAGALKDALFLLKIGHKVISFEKNRIIYDLLFDALRNADFNVLTNLELQYLDFETYQNINHYQYCLLDPMFSHDRKALPKKDMVLFKEIIGDAKTQNLLTHANKLNLKKIIVKRADKAEYLENKKPSYQLKGKTIRFDIYLAE